MIIKWVWASRNDNLQSHKAIPRELFLLNRSIRTADTPAYTFWATRGLLGIRVVDYLNFKYLRIR